MQTLLWTLHRGTVKNETYCAVRSVSFLQENTDRDTSVKPTGQQDYKPSWRELLKSKWD